MDADDLLSLSSMTDNIQSRRCFNYIIYYQDGLTPCYVGKGTERSGSRRQRYDDHAGLAGNKALAGVYRKAGGKLPVVVITAGVDELTAFALETFWIRIFGRVDQGMGPLVNHTDGGDGGLNPSIETRAKMSLIHKGKPKSEDTKQRMSVASIGVPKTGNASKGVSKSKNHRQNISAAIQNWHANLSTEEKEARRANISVATKLAMAEPGVSQKISDALSGRTHDEARRAITSASLIRKYQEDPDFRRRNAEHLNGCNRFSGKKHSEETKRKMSESQKLRQERERLTRETT